jgi:hypothetical protein
VKLNEVYKVPGFELASKSYYSSSDSEEEVLHQYFPSTIVSNPVIPNLVPVQLEPVVQPDILPDPVIQPEPVNPVPVQPEPVNPVPVQPEPVNPVPVQPEPNVHNLPEPVPVRDNVREGRMCLRGDRLDNRRDFDPPGSPNTGPPAASRSRRGRPVKLPGKLGGFVT